MRCGHRRDWYIVTMAHEELEIAHSIRLADGGNSGAIALGQFLKGVSAAGDVHNVIDACPYESARWQEIRESLGRLLRNWVEEPQMHVSSVTRTMADDCESCAITMK